MATTKIQWADMVWNPVTGCSKVSDGCAHCYAERQALRLQHMGCDKYKNGFKVTLHPEELNVRFPGKGKQIFVCSMADLFHEDVPFLFVDLVMARIAISQQHTFMILTKRPYRMQKYFNDLRPEGVTKSMISDIFARPSRYFPRSFDKLPLNCSWPLPWPLPNLWLLTTAENQDNADLRIPDLLKCPARVHGVSIEPMLGAVDLGEYLPNLDENGYPVNQLSNRGKYINWVICGGESGPGARPIHPDWIRGVRNQCQDAGTPFFFKQWGEWLTTYDRDDDPDARNLPHEIPNKTRWLNLNGGHGFHGERVVFVHRVGKAATGDYIDGKQYHEFP